MAGLGEGLSTVGMEALAAGGVQEPPQDCFAQHGDSVPAWEGECT